MSLWCDYYIERVNNKLYFERFKTRYELFLKEIINIIKPGDHIREDGCGIGTVTKAITDAAFTLEQYDKIIHNVNFYLIDIDPMMLALAKLNISSPQVQFHKWNIIPNDVPHSGRYTNKVYDLIHSHGVLEHFNDEQIQKITKRQIQLAHNVIHYVPSNKYNKPSFGDERLMSPQQWKDICNPDEIIEFNDGYDLILKWEKK